MMNKSFNDVINSIADDIQIMMETVSEIEKESSAGNQKGKYDRNRKRNPEKGKDSVVADILRHNFSERMQAQRKIKSPRVSDIIEWAQQRGLSTGNQNIELINRFLCLDGHAGQPILSIIDKEMERMQDKWADTIYDAMVKELEKIFE